MVRVGVVGCGPQTHADAWIPLINGTKEAPAQLERMRVTAGWDIEPANAQRLAVQYGIEAVESPREMLGRVDAAMVTALDFSLYLDLARVFLEAGIPTFVNRPLAQDVPTARRTLEIAGQHGTPILSASSLYFADGVRRAQERLGELGPLRTFIASVAGGHFDWYVPHTISTFYPVVGPGVEFVCAWGAGEKDAPPGELRSVVAYVQYRADAPVGRVQGMLQLLPYVGYGEYHLTLFGEKARTEEMDGAGENVYLPLLRAMEEMFVTGREPIAHEQMLEMARILYAARRSHQEGGRPVALGEVG